MRKKATSNINKTEFEKIFLSNYQSLFLLGFKMSGDRNFTKDVIQDLFLEIWEKRNQLNEIQYWNAYLRKSLHRKMATELKKHKALSQNSSPEDFNLSSPSYEELLINFQTKISQQNSLKSAIEKLPEQEKYILNLRFFEEMSYEDIAEKTGKSKQTVYNQIFSAIKRLRKSFCP